MAWEERGGKRYYYRKVRKGGQVFSVYEGGGIGGEIAAAQDAGEQEKKTQTRAELQREMAAQDRIDYLIGEAELMAQAASRTALESAGFHLHKRSWRLKRNAK
ncbi:MAG TPA: hypothetical protein VEX70_13335 [Pyrinomonadaceae bacterium]|nr:hypothetical protein [Pyrinomonadaceae bacterium]